VKIWTFRKWALDNGWKRPAAALDARQQEVLETMVEDWVYLDALKLFYRFETDDKWDHKQIDNSLPRVFLPKKDPEKPPTAVSMSEYLLHRAPGFNKLHSLTYLPGVDDRIVEVTRRSRLVRVMNLWTDGDIVAAQGNVQPFLDQVSYLIPDPMECHLFLAALAWAIKRRGKMMFAILLQGVPGTGKSWVVSIIQMILGVLNCREVETEELMSSFNDWLDCVELVVVNEIRDPTADKRELMNKVKTLITQPTIRINAKHQKRYEMPTPYTFICMTNDQEPIYIDDDDRRWFVFKSPAVPKLEEDYNALFAYSGDLGQVKRGRQLTAAQRENLGAIKHFLERYPMERAIEVDGVSKVVRFNGLARAPITEGRNELVELSYSDSFKWVRDSIQNCQWPFTFDLIRVDAIVGEPGNLPLNLRSMSARKLGADLRKAGAVLVGNMILPSGPRVRCWAVRDIEKWKATTDKARGAYYQDRMDLVNDVQKSRDRAEQRIAEEIQTTKSAFLKGKDYGGKPMQ
jgi:hypothetical protein